MSYPWSLGPLAARLRPGPLARQSLLSLGVKIFALAMGFSFAVLAARLLGASGYGEMAVALSAAGIASIVGGLGINGLAVRETARLKVAGESAKLHKFILWSLVATGAASIAAAAALAVISRRGGSFAEELLIAAPITVLLAFLHLARGLKQGAGQITAAQLPLDVIRWVLIVGALVMVLVSGSRASPSAVLWLMAAALFVSVLVAAMGVARLAPGARTSGAAPESREPWLRAATPFLGIALFGIAGAEVNTILLGWLAGPEQAGLFQPLARIAPIMILAADAIAMPLSPRVSALWHSGGKTELKWLVRKSAIAATISTVAIAGMILLFAPAILGMFGGEFVENGRFLVWIAAAQLVNAAVGPAPLLLSMAGKMRHRIAVQLVTLLVQISVAAMLIPSYGAGGAALALAIGILAWSLLHWVVARLALGIDTSVFGRLPAVMRSGNVR